MPRSTRCRAARWSARCCSACSTASRFPTNVDETGRLVLPAKLRAKIELEDEAFFIAAGDTFQIWKPETYETEELAKTEEWLDDLPDDFDPLEYP